MGEAAPGAPMLPTPLWYNYMLATNHGNMHMNIHLLHGYGTITGLFASFKGVYRLQTILCNRISLTWHGYSIITELEDFCPETAKSTDENGDTPLHLACSYGFVEVAEHLIKGGADIEARFIVMDQVSHVFSLYGTISGMQSVRRQ